MAAAGWPQQPRHGSRAASRWPCAVRGGRCAAGGWGGSPSFGKGRGGESRPQASLAPSYGVPGIAAGCFPDSGSGAGSGSGVGSGRGAQKADRPGVFPVSR